MKKVTNEELAQAVNDLWTLLVRSGKVSKSDIPLCRCGAPATGVDHFHGDRPTDTCDAHRHPAPDDRTEYDDDVARRFGRFLHEVNTP